MFSRIKSYWQSVTRSDEPVRGGSTLVQNDEATLQNDEATLQNDEGVQIIDQQIPSHTLSDDQHKTIILEPESASESSTESEESGARTYLEALQSEAQHIKFSYESESSSELSLTECESDFTESDDSSDLDLGIAPPPPAPPAPPASFAIPIPPPRPRAPRVILEELPVIPQAARVVVPSPVNFDIPKLLSIEAGDCELICTGDSRKCVTENVIVPQPQRAVLVTRVPEVSTYDLIVSSIDNRRVSSADNEISYELIPDDYDSLEYEQFLEEECRPLLEKEECEVLPDHSPVDVGAVDHNDLLMELYQQWVDQAPEKFEMPHKLIGWNFSLIQDLYKTYINELNQIPDLWYNAHIKAEIKKQINIAFVNTYCEWADGRCDAKFCQKQKLD